MVKFFAIWKAKSFRAARRLPKDRALPEKQFTVIIRGVKDFNREKSQVRNKQQPGSAENFELLIKKRTVYFFKVKYKTYFYSLIWWDSFLLFISLNIEFLLRKFLKNKWIYENSLLQKNVILCSNILALYDFHYLYYLQP